MGKQKHIPKLRFREFGGEWEIKLLSQIAEKSSKKNKDKKVTDVFTNSAIHGIVNQRDYFDKDIANQKNLLDYYIVDSNDFVYNPRISENAPVGPMRRNHNDTGVMSPLYTVIRFKACDLDFIEHYFLTNHWHSYMELIANYGARADRMSIRTEQLFKMPIPLPTLPEQKKIADFLSAIDERIQYLTKKKELLEQYKRGVMQKIFSQKLRFKDESGKPFPKWEKRKLETITTNFSRRNKSLITADVYSVTNKSGFVLQSEQFTDRKIAGDDRSSYKIVRRGEYAYNPARINVGSIAQFYEEIGIISSLYVCFRLDSDLVSDKYFNLVLQLDSVKNQIKDLGEGGVRIYLWYDLFKLIRVPLPSLPEQKKIADFLTAIDDKIEHVARQLEKTMEYKKGLLQQMFV